VAGDPLMRVLAEIIASAFASGFSWGGEAAGKQVYCASPDLKGREIMSAFEQFLQDNPDMAEKPYGDAMAGALTRAFPCKGL
jgi:Rap1a immunity proteins